MSVTLCMGNNCKVRDTCKRYIKNYAGPVIQMLPVIDWSSYGSGKADSNGVEVSYTCGDNSENYPLLDPIETDADVMAAALSKLGIPEGTVFIKKGSPHHPPGSVVSGRFL